MVLKEDEMSSSCAFAEELYDLYHVQAVQWTCVRFLIHFANFEAKLCKFKSNLGI